ncbi:MAG TPA: pyridoxamine 5'-phosphate oxidase family protein [Symbiobacteriaceae bacterium]|nr:pyridoxamine 5'-phosphate oxidase family protein [Symbiobacteriaceae bacterium]
MALIAPEVKRFIEGRDHLGWVCTVDSKGMPNVSPRFVLEIGPDWVAWGNSFTNKTFYNMGQNSSVTVGFADYDRRTGYELSGRVELIGSGELFDRVCAKVMAKGFPRANKVSVLTVTQVRNLAK